ncbi:hypothetical protein ES288_A08G078800v1 [Gossypium darwinii]|uniref:Brix domain-containing protein n=1 Tax=Gossypium darwinii TaxID=34276 RepID=A0A5D2FGV4_GOSDA|nr:hypothetical protein ES288_D10G274100v1 [Gossypium darwinii]TYH05385.1 hypothetical protein ES288_A08G078800v1 [Gossypium darwinii]
MFSRGKLPGPLRQLQMDLRKLMLPYTALKLKEKKRNNLKDFLNVAGPMGVTHFLALLSIAPSLPAGSFQESSFGNFFYSHCLSSGTFKIVLFGFAAADEQLRLTTMVFKNIFPDIDINTVSSLRQLNYSIQSDLISFLLPSLTLFGHEMLQVKLSSCQRIVLINYNKNVSSLHKDRSVGEAGTSALLDDSWFSSDSFLHCFCKTRKLKELLENSLGWEFQQKSAVDGIYFEENDEYAPVVEMLDEPSGSEPTS